MKYRNSKKPELRSRNRSRRLSSVRFPNLLRTLNNCPALDIIPQPMRAPFMKKEHISIDFIGELEVDPDLSKEGIEKARKAYHMMETELVNKIGISAETIERCMNHFLN